ncbi:hypothetical protein ACFZDM_33505 [Streptomyces californicus]|uniref:hypothetical protein n=1 Tax=Streptomyces californicus TaxID=67351 RepID=UPI0036E6B870
MTTPEPAATITGADWLVVTEALETAGWIGDDDNPLEILRKDGAVWAVSNDCGDSQLGAGGWSVAFPSDTPVLVIVAACLAAVGQPAITAETVRHLGIAPDPS